MTSVHWLSWQRTAFERARAERKPVLLSISTSWCRWCREMDRTSYADPRIASIINERFVPIRVDADRRPDISERYTLGGWPTTAFLSADGALVGGGTFVPLERMPEVLDRVLQAFAERREQIALGLPPAQPAHEDGRPCVAPEQDLEAQVFSTFDPDHGGFGAEPKFPLVAPVRLALEMLRTRPCKETSAIAVTTLDRMGWGPLYDEVDGGFFRCAAARDWTQPRMEKLLEVNAQLLALYLDAAEVLGLARYRDRARDVARYVQNVLADPVHGGWGGSQAADAVYYEARPAEARRGLAPPPVDRVLYAGWNGLMVSAALRACRDLEDTSLGEFAVASLERVLAACYRPGAGVAHYFDGAPGARGLLDDQIHVAAACLDAYEATGRIPYEMMAEELAHYVVRTMRDPAGGFFDRAAAEPDEDIGLMNRRMKPFAGNCEAAAVLRRVAEASGEHEFSRMADETLAAMAPCAAGEGPLAAHYLLALRPGASG